LDYFSRAKLIYFGPSVVRALPLAAGINVGGHYKWHFFLLLFLSFFRLIANSHRRGCRRVSNFFTLQYNLLIVT
jgi:hypothetical protein